MVLFQLAMGNGLCGCRMVSEMRILIDWRDHIGGDTRKSHMTILAEEGRQEWTQDSDVIVQRAMLLREV